jgi:hypothetical protein
MVCTVGTSKTVVSKGIFHVRELGSQRSDAVAGRGCIVTGNSSGNPITDTAKESIEQTLP